MWFKNSFHSVLPYSTNLGSLFTQHPKRITGIERTERNRNPQYHSPVIVVKNYPYPKPKADPNTADTKNNPIHWAFWVSGA